MIALLLLVAGPPLLTAPQPSWPGPLPSGTVPDFELTESAQRAFRSYLAQTLVLHIRGSSRAPTLFKNGERLDVGVFGEGYDEIFQTSPRALQAAARFRRMRVAGMASLAISGALFVATIVLTATRAWPALWSLAGAGSVVSTGAIGGFLIAFSPAEMSRAVAYYNEDTMGASPFTEPDDADEP